MSDRRTGRSARARRRPIPCSGVAIATAWKPSPLSFVQVSPPSSERSVPVGPTAIRVGPVESGTRMTAER